MEYRAVVEEMLEDWEHHQAGRESFPMSRVTRPTQEAQFALVYAFAAHVYAVAKAYLAVIDVGPQIAATPLARMCYQTAVTAHWIAQSPDGFKALGNEEIRQRSATVNALKKAASSALIDGTKNVKHADLAERMESDNDTSTRNFSEMCDDLTPGGVDAYLIYRLLSMESHPTVYLADQWLEENHGPDGPPTLLSDPRPPEPDAEWIYIVAASMVWAGRALDFFEEKSPRRDYFRRKAREIGCADVLKLSQAYHKRTFQKRRAEREAKQGGAQGSTRVTRRRSVFKSGGDRADRPN